MTCCDVENELNFSIVTNNDDMIQINVFKSSDGLPASIASVRWDMFYPGTRDVAVTKSGDQIILINTTVDGVLYPNSAFKFLLEHTDTADLDIGKYVHEPTIITTDGRIHTVTQGDINLMPGIVTVREIYTAPPS